MSLTAIRAAIRTRLLTVAEFVNRVDAHRFAGDALKALPAAVIIHLSTDRQPLTLGASTRYQCISQIAVEIHASGANLQDTLDLIGGKAIAAVESTKDLSGAAFDARCSGWVDELSSEADTPRGTRVLNFAVEWQTVTTY
jgi:hypothetical protein